jgi:peptidoglycan/LPS O-acetylase OafA/YrhL
VRTSGGRIDGLDLLRGIAVGFVMLRHAWPSTFTGAGVVGVVMFFAISGYLITGLLLDELDRNGRIDLRRFYVRRARRLVPALSALVGGVVVVTLMFDPLGDRDELGKTVVVALTWTANLPFGHGSDATFHLWTLATEEQFYLVWPAILAVAFSYGRLKLALVVAASTCVLACLATVVWLSEAPDLAYSLPTSWALCFVIGGAARCYAGASTARLVPAALAGLGILCMVPLRDHAATYLVVGPAIAAVTVILLLSWRTWDDVTGPARVLVLLGTVSYGAYLWNYPLTIWLRPSLETYAGPVALLLTLAAAALSWRLVESPMQHRRTAEVVRA